MCPEGWLRPTVYCQCSKGDVSWRGSALIWRSCQITRHFSSLSQAADSKLRTPPPMRLWVLGSGDMMISTARWSLKSLPFTTVINCSTQEYDTHLTTNDEGGHFENRTGCQNTTHYLWSIREKDQTSTVPTRRKPCWLSAPVMSPSGNARSRQLGPVMSPSGHTRPRQFSSVISPSGNTRPRQFGPVISPSGTPGLGITIRVQTHAFSRRVRATRWRKTARSCSKCARKGRGL